MKVKRQNKILDFVKNRNVETQEDLLVLLKEEGFNVTQATISRDIKELRLVKSLGSDGKYKYVVANHESHTDLPSKFLTIFNEAVIAVDNGMNIVSIQCHSGMAQAVCAAMDSMHFSEVISTLAGDDTIFVLCRTTEDAIDMVAKLNNVFGR